jgi:hypothetical protein
MKDGIDEFRKEDVDTEGESNLMVCPSVQRSVVTKRGNNLYCVRHTELGMELMIAASSRGKLAAGLGSKTYYVGRGEITPNFSFFSHCRV